MQSEYDRSNDDYIEGNTNNEELQVRLSHNVSMKYVEGNTSNEELQDLLSHDVLMKQSTKVKPENNDRKCRGPNLSPATAF